MCDDSVLALQGPLRTPDAAANPFVSKALALPIIDVHLHAYDASQWKGSQPNPVTGRPEPATADEHGMGPNTKRA